MRRRGETVFGGLNVLTGALMIWGGGVAVLANRGIGLLPVVVGGLGALTGSLLLISGILLLARRSGARRLAFAAALTVFPVHAVGVLAALIGALGVLFGIVYPAALLAWLMRTRGTPEVMSGSTTPPSNPLKRDAGHPRVAIA